MDSQQLRNLAQRLRHALEAAERETEDVLDEWSESTAYHVLQKSIERITQDIEEMAERGQ